MISICPTSYGGNFQQREICLNMSTHELLYLRQPDIGLQRQPTESSQPSGRRWSKEVSLPTPFLGK
eukprot:1679091-Pyramimonas_sp.AAC.1